jgi:hypothetical protein
MTSTNPIASHTHTVSGKRTTAAGGHSHGLTATDTALAAAVARITALEASMANVVLSITQIQQSLPPPVPPPIEPTPGTQITVTAGNKGVRITANNQVVENVVITGPGDASYDTTTDGIYGLGAYTGVIIRHVTIRGMRHAGIWLDGLVNPLIEDVVIEDVGYAGIMAVRVVGGIFRRNTIRRVGDGTTGLPENNNAYGIAISGYEPTPSSDILVEDNVIEDVPLWHGLDTHGGQRITFHHNTVRRAPRAIFVTSMTTTKATDCVISDNLFTEPVATVPPGTNAVAMTTYDTVDCAFTGNVIGSAYGAPTVYDYSGLSTGLTQSGNVNGEALP